MGAQGSGEDNYAGPAMSGCFSLFHEPLQQPWGRLPIATLQVKGLRLRSPRASKQQSWIQILARVSLAPQSAL